MDWNQLAQNREVVAGYCEHGSETKGCMKFWEIIK
jgi:hypothetical protein